MVCRARSRLSSVLNPFFSLLTEYTGLDSFTLIGGTPPDEDAADSGKFLLAAVNYGMTSEISPRNFYDFNPDAWNLHIWPLFMDFLHATKGISKLLL